MKRLGIITTFIFSVLFMQAQFPGGFPGLQGGLGGLANLGNFGGGGGGQNTNFTAPENWIPDSVPLRITRFQESILDFYSSSPVDTTVHHFEIIPPREKFNDVWLGNNAYAWYPNDFEQRMKYQYQDFYFLNPFLDRFFNHKNFSFFRTNRPYTDLYYASSSKETEQPIVRAIHTQNIDYFTNIGFAYQAYSAKEFVRQSNSSVSSLILWFSKEKQKYRYQINFYLNNVKLLDNGGIIDTGEYNPEYEQYYLTKAKTRIGYMGVNFNPEYIILRKKNFKLTIQNYGEASRHYHSYYDENPIHSPEIYQHIYVDSSFSYDSVSYDLINDELRLKAISKYGNYLFSAGYEGQNFYYFRGYIYKPKSLWYNNLYIKGGLEKFPISHNIHFGLYGQYYLLGRKATNTTVKSQLSYKGKIVESGLQGEYMSLVPSYFIVRYRGNTNRWENNQFDNQNIARLNLWLTIPSVSFKISASLWNISNYITFSNAVPIQYRDSFNVYQLKIQKNLHLKFIHFDNWVNIQYSDQNSIVDLPLVMAQSSIWLDFYLFKRAMHLNTGADIYYTTAYRQYFYNPAIVAFYQTADKYTGNFPIVNLFVNIHVKRMSLFFKFDFVNPVLNSTGFYTTALHYHYPTFYYRFGARWWFKN